MCCWALLLLTRSTQFSRVHCYFFETPSPPLPQSSHGVGGFALGRGCKHPNPAQSPILGEQRGAVSIPRPCLGSAQLTAPQNPRDFVFPWVCGLGIQLGSGESVLGWPGHGIGAVGPTSHPSDPTPELAPLCFLPALHTKKSRSHDSGKSR